MLKLPGNTWRDKYQATVDGILTPQGVKRTVTSQGEAFFNQDRWTAATAYRNLIRKSTLDLRSLSQALDHANSSPAPDPMIYIARAPDDMTWEIALALNGGAAHEAWHTLFSMRDDLTSPEMRQVLEPFFGSQIEPYRRLLEDGLDNVLEDIRIERLGLERWAPFQTSMLHLHDFVLGQEKRLKEPRSVFIATLRDLGFGYQTDTETHVHAQRREDCSEVMALFEEPWMQQYLEKVKQGGGPLDFLGQSFELCQLLGEHKNEVIESILEDPTPSKVKDPGGAFEVIMPSLQAAAGAWNPESTAQDRIEVPSLPAGPSARGEQEEKQALRTLDDVQTELNYLRSRLRAVLRSETMTRTKHGAKRGSRLSGRNLVLTSLEARAGEEPSKAYTRRSKRREIDVAAAVSLDLSSSTIPIQNDLARVSMLVTEAVEGVQGKVVSFGWSDQWYASAPKQGFHRSNGVTYTIFKEFHERTAATRSRYGRARPGGPTPMADGIQFGTYALCSRNESLKLMFVVTDGDPNLGTTHVVKDCVQRACQNGIHVVGVGIGSGCRKVPDLFPESIVAEDVKSLPELLVQLLIRVLK